MIALALGENLTERKKKLTMRTHPTLLQFSGYISIDLDTTKPVFQWVCKQQICRPTWASTQRSTDSDLSAFLVRLLECNISRFAMSEISIF